MTQRLGLFISIIALILQGPMSLACSSFASPDNNNFLMAKSYDWSLSHGMLTVNKRNVAKSSLALKTTDKEAHWVSQYGSVTFNQYGRELPLGGMNEAGLAIEILWLFSTQYPKPDKRSSLNEGQWVQYFLDNYSSVEEMVLGADKVRPSSVFAEVHYLACDKTGDCATFEFINGKLEIHSQNQMPVKTLTNSEYGESSSLLSQYKGFGGSLNIPQSGYDSDDRFVRLSAAQKDFVSLGSDTDRYDHAFSMLDSVESSGYSVWHIVYDFKNSKILFRRLDLDRQNTKVISLNAFDYSCSAPVKTFDLDQELNGDITSSFVDYDPSLNRKIVKKSGEHHGLPAILVSIVSQYPESTSCKD